MRKILLLSAFLCLAPHAKAQLKTYLTLEAGPQWSLFKASDPGGYFKGARVRNSIAGLTIGQEVIPNLSLVTGLYYQPYSDGINMIDDRPQQPRWSAYTALLIPLRAEYRIQFSEFPVSLTPRLGYMYGKVSRPEAPYSASGTLSAPDGTVIRYDLSHTYDSENLHFLEAGIGLNLRFSGIWQASVNLSYLVGFTDPVTSAVDYSGAGAGMNSATYSSGGNTIYTSLAFGIPVSNIWQNRDYRIRSRVENSVYEGKPTDRKGQIYVGGELGSLWRLFNITNPAFGARPMADRGLFRYANLHAGGYAGYMVSEDLGIDIGVYYQQSTTFYSLMYDHEVDFVVKTPAPLFLEFPLRIRYFYNVYKKKLFYVVYGGASLLTHFSSGEYNQGGGGFTYNTPSAGGQDDAVTAYSASRTGRIRPLMRLGTGVEYELPTRFPLIATLMVNYMHGFVSADEIRITNTLPESPAEGVISYNGSGWSLEVGIRIPLSFGRKGQSVTLPEGGQGP